MSNVQHRISNVKVKKNGSPAEFIDPRRSQGLIDKEEEIFTTPTAGVGAK
jgi:hypothetical protein